MIIFSSIIRVYSAIHPDSMSTPFLVSIGLFSWLHGGSNKAKSKNIYTTKIEKKGVTRT